MTFTDTCSEPNNELVSDLCIHEFLLDQIRVFLRKSTTLTLSEEHAPFSMQKPYLPLMLHEKLAKSLGMMVIRI
jgi:hypothetical protein